MGLLVASRRAPVPEPYRVRSGFARLVPATFPGGLPVGVVDVAYSIKISRSFLQTCSNIVEYYFINLIIVHFLSYYFSIIYVNIILEILRFCNSSIHYIKAGY